MVEICSLMLAHTEVVSRSSSGSASVSRTFVTENQGFFVLRLKALIGLSCDNSSATSWKDIWTKQRRWKRQIEAT